MPALFAPGGSPVWPPIFVRTQPFLHAGVPCPFTAKLYIHRFTLNDGPMTSAIEDWLPKSVILLRNYDRHKFISDLIAGVTAGLVALPLAMAFAIASGVPPQAGLNCAIVTGFLISALGGSKTQIGGPTGAFVVVVAGIIAKHGIDGL